MQEGDLVGDACTVVDYIGRGAMGHVYRVRHNLLNAEYALKMLSREQAGEEASRLFQREAGAIKILSHPNLVRIYDVGLHGGKLPYYAMELLVGRDLGKVVRDSGPLSPIQAASIFNEVCAGLAYVHAKGIVHRDIKPSNIFLLDKAGSSGERVKVVDFGIVSFTRTKSTGNQAEEIHGTPYYMSPEQCMGQPVDARSDIYSLGCTMFEALTGNLPFSGKSPTETMEMQVRQAAPTLREKAGGKEFPAAWETIIAKTMAKDPADRYQTMEEISTKLAEVLSSDKWSAAMASSTGSITGAGAGSQTGATSSGLLRSKTFLIGGGAIVCLGVVIAIGLAFQFTAGTHSASSTPPAAQKIETAQPLPAANDTKVAEPLSQISSEAGPDSLKGDKPFASDIIDGGKMVHKFDLPKDVSIGWFRTRLSEAPLPATGELKFPMNARLTFTPSKIVDKYPYCLKRFQAEDIRALKFEPDACTDQIFAATAHLTGVRKISIAGCRQLTDRACGTLKNFPNLNSFDASETNLKGSQLAQAAVWDKIEVLALASVEDLEPLLSELTHSPHLQKLVLSKCRLKPEEIETIGRLTHLKDLDISQNKLTRSEMVALSKLTHLTDLHLSATGLSGVDLEPLKTMKHLAYLDFSANSITTEDLNALTNTFECSELDLRNTNLDASIVENLKNYGSLKKLHIDSKQLKAGDLKKIREGLPLVQVD
ncbi:MAG: serine/threonine protein kinase [Cyanobacteria bacterium REEB67]|nr:serine/threonine protein kinase [Cyanobacteria bacterium REEB67]